MMDTKAIMVIILLGIVFVSLLNFGYLATAIYSDATPKTGAEHFNQRNWMFYGNIMLHIIALMLGGGIFMKK